MNKQQKLNKKYNSIRNSIIRSMKYYKKQGALVEKYFSLPAVPKKVTAASIRKIKYAQAEWRYIIGRGSAPAGSEVTKRGFQMMIKEYKLGDINHHKYLEWLNKEDNLRKSTPGYEKNIHYTEEEIEAELEGANILPSWEGMAMEKLWAVIYDAYDKAQDPTGGGGRSGKQQAYFARVWRHAELAQTEFWNAGLYDDKEANEKLIDKLTPAQWDRLETKLEKYIWYDSDQPWTSPHMDVIRDIITEIVSGKRSRKQKESQANESDGVEDI